MKSKILNEGIKHLSKDKKLNSLINEFEKPVFYKSTNYYDDLCKSIIYQQLSGKVAKIIYHRFLNLFPNKVPNFKKTLDLKFEELKKIGLSKQKITYIDNLAKYFYNKKNIDFVKYSDESLRKELIKIKGIGPWTIDMFLMFTMHRTDILPVGDLGIKKAFQILYKLKELPSKELMIEMSAKWKPYRTIACCYLWYLVDDGDVW
ncbi:MAG: hypothetical protein CMF80_04730 [Candidatus Marinimicrobia bacterium]|nr:hypothetical protein [Candidatus Neomarinimicrobiota bacterium]|tara:strand:- start:122 stop:733 length:612 start_codon:yes stop_codon:yes gene_type:complete